MHTLTDTESCEGLGSPDSHLPGSVSTHQTLAGLDLGMASRESGRTCIGDKGGRGLGETCGPREHIPQPVLLLNSGSFK